MKREGVELFCTWTESGVCMVGRSKGTGADRRVHVGAGETKRAPSGSVEAYHRGLTQLVRKLGERVAERLSAGGGSREDALRGPVEELLEGAGRLLGRTVVPVGENLMAELGVRPDYAVDVDGTRTGILELKAPGTGVPDAPGWGRSAQERRQWERLATLPNVVYSDGTHWTLYQSGEPKMRARCRPSRLETAGARLEPEDDGLANLLVCFLEWAPDPPKSMARLIETVARLCGVLRDEVAETLVDERAARRARLFSGHVEDWRRWLFPLLTDAEFADSYAQTVTFGLLLARRDGVDFEGLDTAAIGERLAKRHLLLGRALTVLTARQGQGPGVEDTSTVLQTLRRVIAVVDWDAFRDRESPHLLYEHFLDAYDPTLRRQSGSYYTPEPLTTFMVRFVDDVLRSSLNLKRGFANPGVVVVDPAMGTGSFLLGVVDQVADTVTHDGGDVPASLRALMSRLVGFERQIGPFAVAELKLHHALARWKTEAADDDLDLLVTDTLDDPALELPFSGEMYRPLSEARARANEIKSAVKVTVVIGNPPYRERAKSLGGEIVARRRDGSTMLDAFRPPDGRLTYKLHNLATYFWRWATWKVFESSPEDRSGIVAFVTTSAYLTGPAFAGMREYLRRHTDEGWVVDLSPEGHQGVVANRVFPGVQHPICVAVFVRRRTASPGRQADSRAVIHHRVINGLRENKFAALDRVKPGDDGWRRCADDWTSPFTPQGEESWMEYPLLADLMPWRSLGVTSNRSWVWAPHKGELERRWRRTVSAPGEERAALMKETRDRTVQRPHRRGDQSLVPLIAESARSQVVLRPYAARAFDRQWIVDDPRVIDYPRAALAAAHSDQQVYATVHGQALVSGPAVVFTALLPDTHHTAGRGGDVVPTFRDTDGTANITPGLCELLSRNLGIAVEIQDVLAYVAALASHPGYTARFRDELSIPDVRIPLTLDERLWLRGVQLGRRVLWLHTYGERFVDETGGRPARLDGIARPSVVSPVPHTKRDMPDRISYDAQTETIEIGLGRLHPVDARVWAYDVCGMRVLRSWFDYRRRIPKGRKSSPLDDIVAEHWIVDDTEELRTLIGLLTELVTLEPMQEELLVNVLAGPKLTASDLRTAGILPVPPWLRRPPTEPKQASLL